MLYEVITPPKFIKQEKSGDNNYRIWKHQGRKHESKVEFLFRKRKSGKAIGYYRTGNNSENNGRRYHL